MDPYAIQHEQKNHVQTCMSGQCNDYRCNVKLTILLPQLGILRQLECDLDTEDMSTVKVRTVYGNTLLRSTYSNGLL